MRRKRIPQFIAGMAVLGAAWTAHADPTEQRQMWRYEGDGGPAMVTLVQQRGGARTIEFQPDAGRERVASADRSDPGSYWFPTSPGAAGALEGLRAERQGLVLIKAGDGYKVELRKGDSVQGRGKLRRVRAALLAPTMTFGNDGKAFLVYARELERYYKQQGYDRVDVAPVGSVSALVEPLEDAGEAGRPYRRVVIIGHGGWDGPMFRGQQASGEENRRLFQGLIEAIRRGTTPDAKIFSSSCHAGGSDRYEVTKPGNNEYRWTDDLARRTGRIVAGPMGKTSTEYTYQNVLAILEGQGTTKQEVRWSSPDGSRTIRPGRTLASAQTVAWTTPEPGPLDLTTPTNPIRPIAPVTLPAGHRPVVDLPLGSLRGAPPAIPADPRPATPPPARPAGEPAAEATGNVLRRLLNRWLDDPAAPTPEEVPLR